MAQDARLSSLRQLWLSSYWFAYNLQWAALLAIALPSQISLVAGDARKELATGIVTGVGALFSLILTPLAGALSDHSRSRLGRRRPFLLVGTLVNIAFLLAMGGMGAGTSLLIYTLVYLGVQFGSNWAGGPYAALIPDLVPPSQRGAASGWMALMSTLGTLAGALVAGQLTRAGHYGPIVLVIAATLVVALVVTLVGVREGPLPLPVMSPDVREKPASAAATRRRLHERWTGFLPDPRAHRDFYWVLGTRCLIGMGIYSVFSFFQFFLGDVLRVTKPEEQASFLIGIIIAAGIPTSLVAGMHSDRTGRKPLVYLSGGVMAAASVAFMVAGAAQSLPWIFAVGALFGIGYGAYQAADWALAVDVLPPGDSAGRDMGIWHVALVLPQALAPALAGALLAAIKPYSLVGGYAVVFTVTAVWFTLGTVLVRRVRGAR